MLARPRKTREFTGPTPNSVAIQERQPTTRPRDYLIKERHRTEQQRQVFVNQKQAQDTFDIKNDWEHRTNESIRINNIQRNVASKLFDQEIQVEERRNQLCALLVHEEENHMKELESHMRGETQTERLAKMRHRAKELTRKREDERLKIVEEKSEQRWRGECEELRAVLSRRHQDQVCAARGYQIETKQIIKKELEFEDAIYAKLWRQDELIKAAREEQEAKEQILRNHQVCDVLSAQVQDNQHKRQKEKSEIEQEAKRLKEEQAQRIQELEYEKNQLMETQRNYRIELNNHKIERAMREKQMKEEEYKLEKEILNEASKALDDEATFTTELKDQRAQYENEYRNYIAQQRQEEAAREANFDKMYQEDQKREWQLRDNKQRQQDKARSDLMKQVYSVREQQLNFKEAERKDVIAADIKERNRILADVDEFRQTEAQRLQEIANKNRNFQSDLVDQMWQLNTQREAQQTVEQKEFEAEQAKEKAYQERIKRAIQHY